MNIEKINLASEQSGRENEIRAKERNKYRTLGEKLFNKNEYTGIDIAEEEAMKMNEESDKLVNDGEAANYTEAIKKLNDREDPAFAALKGEELIKKEEYARIQGLRIAKKLDEGDIDKARDIFTGNFFRKGYDEETQILTENYVIPFAKEKIINDINQGNGDEVVKMINNFSDYLRNLDIKDPVEFIKPEDLEQIPVEVLKSPAIVEKIKSYLIGNCADHLHPNHYGIFKSELGRFSKLGFISKEDEEEILKSPKIKEVAREKLIQSRDKGQENGPGAYVIRKSNNSEKNIIVYAIPSFKELKKVVLELGILDDGEIEKIESDSGKK